MTITATGNRMTSEIARQARLAQDLARTQVQVSTGKRIQTASDDPVGAARVAQIARGQSDATSWNGALSLGAELASQADGVLQSLSDRINHARTQMIAGASGSASAADRATYAAELRSIADDVTQMRATKNSLGQPLFAPGTAISMRVDRDTTIVPVDSAANVFDRSGVPLTQDLTDAAAALDSGNAAQIATALDRLGTAVDHVANAAGDQGVRADHIDRLSDRNATTSIDLASERSGIEDTDLTAAIAKLNSQQITLEAAQAAFARINRRSLFDILG